MVGGILDHAEERRQIGARARVELGKAGLADGAEDFAGAVGAEVDEEDAVAIADAGIIATA